MSTEQPNKMNSDFESPAAMSDEDYRKLLKVFQPVGKTLDELSAYSVWIKDNRELVEDTGVEIVQDFETDPLSSTQRALLSELNRQLQQAVDENSFAKTPLLRNFLSDNKLWP